MCDFVNMKLGLSTNMKFWNGYMKYALKILDYKYKKMFFRLIIF